MIFQNMLSIQFHYSEKEREKNRKRERDRQREREGQRERERRFRKRKRRIHREINREGKNGTEKGRYAECCIFIILGVVMLNVAFL